MKEAVKCEIKGLKCDNPNCDYIDMSIEVKDYKKYINSKCPECGEILLTEEDYKFVLAMLKMTEGINKLFEGIELPKSEMIKARVNKEKDGSINFTKVTD